MLKLQCRNAKSNPDGLSFDEVKKRQQQYGDNELDEKTKIV